MSKLWPTARTLRGLSMEICRILRGRMWFFLALQKRNAFP